MLPVGVVCDRCNNYFARKIEGPLLQTEYFRHARAKMQVENKRKRVPLWPDFIPELKLPVSVRLNDLSIAVEPYESSRCEEFDNFLLNSKRFSLWSALPDELDNRLMSRFLGKVSIEALAQRLSGVDGWREEMLSQDAIEPLRRYVRIGDQQESWKFNRRGLHSAEHSFGSGDARYQIMHEFDFLYMQDGELIFVLGLFGEEFAINMGGSDTDCYKEYLLANRGESLLAP